MYTWGMCCFKVFWFLLLFPLAIFNFREDLGEEQDVYSTAPSCAISFSLHFSAENLGQQHHPSCWPLSGRLHGPSRMEDRDASQTAKLPFSQKVLSPKPKRD